MSAQPKTFISQEEYLRRERLATYKSEYYQGEIFPLHPTSTDEATEITMAGARRAHSGINANVIGGLIVGLRGRTCTVYTNDLRVHIPENTLYTYPDASVVCGKSEMLDNSFDTLLNPLLIVEVLSDSTEMYDRDTKFQLYRSIASLREYVLVSQYKYCVQSYFLNDRNEWVYTDALGLESSLYLASVDVHLALADIYANVELPSRPQHREIRED
ncbi:MAG: Uma2 family endonuclease [Candidatus Kapaibacterium sp.]|nr:MAG: Uma2 family endonuclease [Candidatus Kapabacteria bacterium]